MGSFPLEQTSSLSTPTVEQRRNLHVISQAEAETHLHSLDSCSLS